MDRRKQSPKEQGGGAGGQTVRQRPALMGKEFLIMEKKIKTRQNKKEQKT